MEEVADTGAKDKKRKKRKPHAGGDEKRRKRHDDAMLAEDADGAHVGARTYTGKQRAAKDQRDMMRAQRRYKDWQIYSNAVAPRPKRHERPSGSKKSAPAARSVAATHAKIMKQSRMTSDAEEMGRLADYMQAYQEWEKNLEEELRRQQETFKREKDTSAAASGIGKYFEKTESSALVATRARFRDAYFANVFPLVVGDTFECKPAVAHSTSEAACKRCKGKLKGGVCEECSVLQHEAQETVQNTTEGYSRAPRRAAPYQREGHVRFVPFVLTVPVCGRAGGRRSRGDGGVRPRVRRDGRA